jgi:type IV pilus assembly protein PilN
MARINLLPWREERRAEKARQFASLLGLSAFMTALIILLVHINIANMIDHQAERNDILIKEIDALELAILKIQQLEKKKAELLSRMEVIQSLQQQRPQIVHLFDEFVRTVPEGIYITSIKQADKSLTIKGVAESNGRVSAYMRNIDQSNWMATPKLKVIETKKGSLRSSTFIVTTSQSTPGKEGEEGEEGGEDEIIEDGV